MLCLPDMCFWKSGQLQAAGLDFRHHMRRHPQFLSHLGQQLLSVIKDLHLMPRARRSGYQTFPSRMREAETRARCWKLAMRYP
jgi:hypothetical protein